MPRRLFSMVITNLDKTKHLGPNPKPARPDSSKGPISPHSCSQTLVSNSKMQLPLTQLPAPGRCSDSQLACSRFPLRFLQTSSFLLILLKVCDLEDWELAKGSPSLPEIKHAVKYWNYYKSCLQLFLALWGPYFICFWDNVSLCSPGWSGILYEC